LGQFPGQKKKDGKMKKAPQQGFFFLNPF